MKMVDLVLRGREMDSLMPGVDGVWGSNARLARSGSAVSVQECLPALTDSGCLAFAVRCVGRLVFAGDQQLAQCVQVATEHA